MARAVDAGSGDARARLTRATGKEGDYQDKGKKGSDGFTQGLHILPPGLILDY
jgi:hypothetical protein